MDNKKLRSTGFIFAAVFIGGFLINLVSDIGKHGFIWSTTNPYQLAQLAICAVFIVSALVRPLYILQPIVFLVFSPVSIIQSTRNIYGLGFFIMGILLLERTGFYAKHRLPKLLLSLIYLLAIEIVGVVRSGKSPIEASAPTFFIVAFGVFLWFLYKDRLVVILKEPKPKLSLAEKGLSTAERAFIGQTLAGKSQKEISIDFELSESTVRNTLARAYKKLDVEDRVGLAVLGERFEINAD